MLVELSEFQIGYITAVLRTYAEQHRTPTLAPQLAAELEYQLSEYEEARDAQVYAAAPGEVNY